MILLPGEQALPALAKALRSERIAVRATQMNPKLLRISATWRSEFVHLGGVSRVKKTFIYNNYLEL